jgi:hypothetical protein
LRDPVTIHDNVGVLIGLGTGQRLHELRFRQDRPPIDGDDSIALAEAGVGESALIGDVGNHEAMHSGPRAKPQAEIGTA